MKAIAAMLLVLLAAAPARAEFGLGGGTAAFEAGNAVTAQALRRQAESGDATAQQQLAWMYQLGNGQPADRVEAAKWFRRAADQGLPDAQFQLAHLYTEGRGVPVDYKTAAHWFTRSAEQGNLSAQYNLAVLYEVGVGVPKDPVQSVRWWRSLAEQGASYAMYKLGVAYRKGQGVEKDRVQAYMWADLATRRERHSAAEILRDWVARKMSAQQIAEAKQRGRAWIDRFDMARAGDAGADSFKAEIRSFLPQMR